MYQCSNQLCSTAFPTILNRSVSSHHISKVFLGPYFFISQPGTITKRPSFPNYQIFFLSCVSRFVIPPPKYLFYLVFFIIVLLEFRYSTLFLLAPCSLLPRLQEAHMESVVNPPVFRQFQGIRLGPDHRVDGERTHVVAL